MSHLSPAFITNTKKPSPLLSISQLMGGLWTLINTARQNLGDQLHTMFSAPQQDSQTIDTSTGKDLERGLGGLPRSETVGAETPGRAQSPKIGQQYMQGNSEVETDLANTAICLEYTAILLLLASTGPLLTKASTNVSSRPSVPMESSIRFMPFSSTGVIPTRPPA